MFDINFLRFRISLKLNKSTKSVICERSKDAGLIITGFDADQIKHDGKKLFEGYDEIGDILFINAHDHKKITYEE